MQPAFELTGRVETVLVTCDFKSIEATPTEKIQCFEGYGIKGDKHAGSRLADVREKSFLSSGLLKGSQIANLRQFSAISLEELAEIGQSMEFPSAIRHGSLGENLVLSGIPRLTELPPGTLLFFKKGEILRTTALFVWGENTPCITPGELIQKQFPDLPGLAGFFPKSAMGKRGIVGGVYSSGTVHRGDTVIARVPTQRLYIPG